MTDYQRTTTRETAVDRPVDRLRRAPAPGRRRSVRTTDTAYAAGRTRRRDARGADRDLRVRRSCRSC